jgi:hypothetical protein
MAATRSSLERCAWSTRPTPACPRNSRLSGTSKVNREHLALRGSQGLAGAPGAIGPTGPAGPSGSVGPAGPSDAWIAQGGGGISYTGDTTLVSIALPDAGSYTLAATTSIFNGFSDATTTCTLMAAGAEVGQTIVATHSGGSPADIASLTVLGAATLPSSQTLSLDCTTTAFGTGTLTPATLVATKIGTLHT